MRKVPFRRVWNHTFKSDSLFWPVRAGKYLCYFCRMLQSIFILFTNRSSMSILSPEWLKVTFYSYCSAEKFSSKKKGFVMISTKLSRFSLQPLHSVTMYTHWHTLLYCAFNEFLRFWFICAKHNAHRNCASNFFKNTYPMPKVTNVVPAGTRSPERTK